MKTLMIVLCAVSLFVSGCYTYPTYDPYHTPWYGWYDNYCYVPGAVRAQQHFFEMNAEGFGIGGDRKWSY